MNNNESLYQDKYDDEISTIEVLSLIFSKKNQIFFLAIFCIICSSIIALMLPKSWTSDTILIPVSGASQTGMASSVSSSIANMTGISLSGGKATTGEIALEVVKSRDFFLHLVNKHDWFLRDLIAIEKYSESTQIVEYNKRIFDLDQNKWITKPSFNTSYESYRNALYADFYDNEFSFISLKITHKSPFVARDMLDVIVSELNEIERDRDISEAEQSLVYLQEQLLDTSQRDIRSSISKLIENQIKTKMFTNVRSNYMLRPIQKPHVPELRSSPQRTRFVVIFTAIGTFLYVFYLLLNLFFRDNKN